VRVGVRPSLTPFATARAAFARAGADQVALELGQPAEITGNILLLYYAPEKPFSIKGLFDVQNS
jgi:hypothetical protein